LISRIIPDLGEIAGKNRERISGAEIFEGERGLRTAYEILLSSASRGEVLCYFYLYDDYHEIASLL